MDKEYRISINSIGKVKEFIRIVHDRAFDIELIYDEKVVDGKSIMGIFSLDISKEFIMRVYVNSESSVEFMSFLTEIDKFIIKDI